MPDRPGGRRRVRDGARIRLPAGAVRADARPAWASAEPPARRAEHGVRPERRTAARSLPRRIGGAEPAGRRRRGAAARVHRRRRALARPGVRADTRVRRAPTLGGAGRVGVRAARVRQRARARGVAGAGDRGAGRRRGPAASRRGDPGAARRASEGPDPRRGRRQPARADRAAARIDAGGDRRRLRGPGRAPIGEPYRAHLPAARPVASARYAASAPDGGGRAAGRFGPAVARRQGSRDRRQGRAPGRGRRTDRARLTRALPTSPRPLVGLPRVGPERSPRRARGARRLDRSGARSRPSRLASRVCDGDSGRGGGRGDGALCRPRARPRRARRGRRVPEAGGRADARSGHARRALARRSQGEARGRRRRVRVRAPRGRRARAARRAPACAARALGRGDRVHDPARARRAAAVARGGQAARSP